MERKALKKVFIDTLFAVALISPRDQYHNQAIELSDRFDGQPMLVTDAVLLEIGNALSRSYKSEASEAIEYFLASSEIEVVHLTPELFEKGFALYGAYKDKTWGLVDCISFAVMREADVTAALTFDRHFEQAGFQVLMREDVSK
jgi:predicted nucleic acid-binding protein